MKTILISERGGTFIELLTAMTLFAATAVGLSPALLGARKAAMVSNNRSAASTLAVDKIEEIRTLTAAPANGTDTSGIFTRSWQTETTNYDTVVGINRMIVRVNWRDRNGDQSVTFVTLVPQ